MFGWQRPLTGLVLSRWGLRGFVWPALKGKREPRVEPVDTTIDALELFVPFAPCWRDQGPPTISSNSL
jgi:hypothetical protein